MKYLKKTYPFYLGILAFCSVHYTNHHYLPVFLLLLGPLVGFAIIKYINWRIKNRKQF